MRPKKESNKKLMREIEDLIIEEGIERAREQREQDYVAELENITRKRLLEASI